MLYFLFFKDTSAFLVIFSHFLRPETNRKRSKTRAVSHVLKESCGFLKNEVNLWRNIHFLILVLSCAVFFILVGVLNYNHAKNLHEELKLDVETSAKNIKVEIETLARTSDERLTALEAVICYKKKIIWLIFVVNISDNLIVPV